MVTEQASAGVGAFWSDKALRIRVDVDEQGLARLGHLVDPLRAEAPADQPNAPGLPLVDLITSGTGRDFSGRRYCDSVLGGRMRYRGCRQADHGPWHDMVVELEDPVTGLTASVTYQVLRDGGVVRSWVRAANTGSAPVTVESVTSFLGGGLAGPGGSLDDVEVWWAENEWLSEFRWQHRAFRDVLPDLNRPAHGSRSRSRLGFTSTGTWSSGTFLPMGAVVNRATGYTMVWQLEHNGGWHWQVGEQLGSGPGASYLALLGPTDAEHHWRVTLGTGEELETVPVAVAVSGQGFEAAIGRMTSYRRALRRPHRDHQECPVIFNDYMNTLMADPTTERLLPLVGAAAEAGAEYFCIDAGWYATRGEGWWDSVGRWAPSTDRFPAGISEVFDHIRAKGMVPGLWIEPEVVGVRSPVADELPVPAFFTRDGERVVDAGRYQLDLSHPAARAHLDRVIDYLVTELGVGYLKMDYNICVSPGTDGGGNRSLGQGMLAHNRALLAWVDDVLDRHRGLTIETCSSGGMRVDYAMLAHFQLQSTSDQQDYLRYPPIAASAPVALAPEQSAVWAYPQPEHDDDVIAFTLCTALLGRVHLSGHLDQMTPAQMDLVAQAIYVYKQIRGHLSSAVPFWPLGLPRWDDPWVALGLSSPGATYLVVWRRGPGLSTGPGSSAATVTLAVGAPGSGATPEVLYPIGTAEATWSAPEGLLELRMGEAPAACLVRLGAEVKLRPRWGPGPG